MKMHFEKKKKCPHAVQPDLCELPELGVALSLEMSLAPLQCLPGRAGGLVRVSRGDVKELWRALLHHSPYVSNFTVVSFISFSISA